MAERIRFGKDDLRGIALYQKIILVCILVYFLLVVSQFVLPPAIQLVLLLVFLGLAVASTVSVFLLAGKLYSSGTAILYGILALIPLVGLIVLLIINGRATTVLKGHGIRVGLLGANSSDLDRTLPDPE